MKKFIIFIAFVLLAVMPKLTYPQAFFKSVFSSIPGSPSFFKSYNPVNIGIAGGASIMESIITPFRRKKSTCKPHQSFSTIMQGLEALSHFI